MLRRSYGVVVYLVTTFLHIFRDVKSSRPTWPPGQNFRPRPRPRPRPRSIFYFITDFPQNTPVKKFENQSIFGEDNGTTTVRGVLFGGHPVLYCIVTDHRRRRGRSSRLDSDIDPMNRQRWCLDNYHWSYKPLVTPADALDTHRQTKPNEFFMSRLGLATVPSCHGTGAPFEK